MPFPNDAPRRYIGPLDAGCLIRQCAFFERRAAAICRDTAGALLVARGVLRGARAATRFRNRHVGLEN
jgi:hypothetical protein